MMPRPCNDGGNADPFSCFGSGGSESDDSSSSGGDDCARDEAGDERGRRLREAANARQASRAIDHVPVTSPSFEVFSCEDDDGFARGQMGLRATKSFRAGDEIMREYPIMRLSTAHAARNRDEAKEKFEVAVQGAFDALSSSNAAAVMELSSCREQEDGDVKTAVGIFNTNVYQLGDETAHGGLFLTTARMNHSCRPNAAPHWRPDLHMMVTHAARDIAIGEEICSCYGPRHYLRTAARREHLREKYSFECACAMCLEGNDNGGDDRMAAIAAFQDNIPLNMRSKPEEALRNVERCLALLVEQGVGNPKGPHVMPLLHLGYQISLLSRDARGAREYLARELVSAQSSQGPGSYKSLDLQQLLEGMAA